MSTISTLSTPPSRADAVNFRPRADTFFGQLPAFGAEANVLGAEMIVNAAAAAAQAAAALASQVAAAASQATASAAAVTAVSSPGTNATATDSVLIGVGSKSFTLQTGKSIVVGMSLKIAYTTSPGNWMLGDVTSYNSGTGALVINITATNGSGTYALWTVSLSSPLSYATLASQTKTANYTAIAGDVIDADTSGGAWALTLPPTPSRDDCITITDLARTFATNNLTLNVNGQKFEGQTGNITCSYPVSFTARFTNATYGWKAQ